MKYYNMYYKNTKINNRPLTNEDVQLIYKSNKYIVKHDSLTNKNEQIPLSAVKLIKTIII